MALAFHHDTHTVSAPAGVVWSSRRAHLVVVAPRTPSPGVAVAPSVYRRRRIVVGFAALVTAAAVVVGVAGALDRQVAAPVARSLDPVASMSSWTTTEDGVLRYVVAEGDSLWNIARRLEGVAPHGQVVQRFVESTGSARIVPGQVLEIRP